MSDRKRNILEAAERIGFFGAANPQLAAEAPSTAGLFTANQNNVERLREAGITASAAGSARMSGTRGKAARAREITEDLRTVARTARLIEKKNSGFRNTFTLPRSGLSYQEITERAASFIADAPAHKTRFDKYALTTEFFAELEADVNAFNETARGQADAQRTGAGAGADIEAIIEDTLDTREELDTALRNHYRKDPAKLAEWLTASHIERRRKGNEPPPDENPPTA